MYISSAPLVAAAVASGIVGSAWAAAHQLTILLHQQGAVASLSLKVIPALQTSPQSTAPIWADLYRRGAALFPQVAVGLALAYGYAAYDVQSHGGQWIGFAAAASSVLAIVPFTLTVMMTTNVSLQKAAKDGIPGSDPQVKHLLNT
ncbi:uncharacterized protein MAM_05449 [Metarhizium album ARSEF 1941]|uniref:Uncharacterized protein n=1 Tax=Metarhizium album (strain ARSEF 1941) TaxID=1081103 RepID=A0A0B2WS91_METAS|nr:uncharacterized protein MAM_05449 [Metarhizium album ARSEF 1941]KHN96893.1 hypothetical protein MAM_05449 [Metarhizium album ARSEF 1941]